MAVPILFVSQQHHVISSELVAGRLVERQSAPLNHQIQRYGLEKASLVVWSKQPLFLSLLNQGLTAPKAVPRTRESTCKKDFTDCDAPLVSGKSYGWDMYVVSASIKRTQFFVSMSKSALPITISSEGSRVEILWVYSSHCQLLFIISKLIFYVIENVWHWCSKAHWPPHYSIRFLWVPPTS